VDLHLLTSSTIDHFTFGAFTGSDMDGQKLVFMLPCCSGDFPQFYCSQYGCCCCSILPLYFNCKSEAPWKCFSMQLNHQFYHINCSTMNIRSAHSLLKLFSKRLLSSRRYSTSNLYVLNWLGHFLFYWILPYRTSIIHFIATLSFWFLSLYITFSSALKIPVVSEDRS